MARLPFHSDCEMKLNALLSHPGLLGDTRCLELLEEARSRLEQLDYLFNEIQSLQAVARRSGLAAEALREEKFRDYRSTAQHFEDELDSSLRACVLFTESYYIFSFRIVEVFRALNTSRFGKETSVAEPIGVRDARNHLIVHPEKVRLGPILSRTAFLPYNSDDGLRLKNLRGPHESQDFQDKGFQEQR